ncbi:hypothetical protein LOTGIDRAFT_154495 [Lottia gigantea]|uniref:Uncharacterized protein n=1 Tax=Lottia gigantea TaxID=225164 RepID=V4A3A5_LOTGI|nr:hypothetical protein LOTGIDRAFT_154495 [Lottia gigantea]ESO89385.1 hypothetical protein LOTGIDRAFT_154495 [Lottia gigantea]
MNHTVTGIGTTPGKVLIKYLKMFILNTNVVSVLKKNILQGLFIFIFHCLFNRQVKDALKIKKRRYRAKSIDTGTGTKSFTQVPMQLNQPRTTLDNDKATNDLDKKTSPFLEADRQVQELAQKLAKVDNNNIKTNANKDNIPVKSNFSIFDNVKIENPGPEPPKPSDEDLYVPVSRISQRKASQKSGAQTVEDITQKPSNQDSYHIDHSSKKSDPNDKPFFANSEKTGSDVLDYPRPDRNKLRIDDYDHLRPEMKENSVLRDYTKLQNRPTQSSTTPNYGVFAEPIQRKMPSIEDNSKQTGYYPDPSVYPAPTSRKGLSPTRRTEPVKPAVAPKTKPKPKRIADDEEDKVDPEMAYEALDAHYMGSSIPTKDPYPSKSSRKPKASSSNPNLNKPLYDNHAPKDKWAKMKESKRRGPHPSEIPNQNRRIHSHENLYRSHGPPYQPTEVHILHDARGHPVSRRAPAYHKGWPDGRGGFNY